MQFWAGTSELHGASVSNQNDICDSVSSCYIGFWQIVFCDQTMRDFFACHSCYAHLAYLLLEDRVWLLQDPLQPLQVNHIRHTQTLTNKGFGGRVMKGCADRQRKQQLLLGGSGPKGGWRVEEGEVGSSRLWFTSSTSPDWSPQTSITWIDRQTTKPCSFSRSCQWIREGYSAHL